MRKVEIRATLWIEPGDETLEGPNRGQWAVYCKGILSDGYGIQWGGGQWGSRVHVGEPKVSSFHASQPTW